jgi:hypothetical protein
MSISTLDERNVLNLQRLVLPADGTGSLALVPVNSNDRRIDSILVANRDTIPHVVTLAKTNTAVTTVLGSLSVPAGQGYAGTPSLDLLASILPASQVGLTLMSADTLNVQLAVAVAATFDLSVSAFGGTF